MYSKDIKDMIGGGVLILLGSSVAIYCMAALDLGTLSQMGPGLFPAALGVILALLGSAVVIPALFRQGERLSVEARPFAFVCAAILAFALTVRVFGLIPSTILLTLIASRADTAFSLRHALILGVVLAAGNALVFHVGLGLQLPLLAWPGV